MNQKTENKTSHSLWDTAGQLCFLILLPAVGIAVGIMVSFWADGLSWMPAFSKTGVIAATVVILVAGVVFLLTGRPVEALKRPLALLGMGAVAIPLMTGLCTGMLSADIPGQDSLDTFMTAGLYVGGASCFVSIVTVIDAFISAIPVSQAYLRRERMRSGRR